MSIFLQAVALVSDLPGSLVYHLVFLFALGFSAAIALSQWWRERLMATARLALAVSLIFSLHLITFGVTLAVTADPVVILPPLDRAISTLTILLIVWAFTFPDPLRLADAVFGGLGFLTLIALGLAWGLWSREVATATAPAFYNGSSQESVWEIAQMVMLGGGLAVFAIRRKSDWPIGLVLLSLLLIGHIAHYLLTLSFQVPGAERLAEILVAPIFAAMVYRRVRPTPLASLPLEPLPEVPVEDTWPRLVVAPATESLAERLSESSPPENRPPAWNLDPKAAVALASLNASTSPADVAQILTVALAHTFNADLCILITPPDSSGAASIAGSYDLITEKFRSGATFLLHEVPTLDKVLIRRESARMTLAEHEPELRRLASAVGLKQTGPALVVPLVPEDGPPLGAIVLLAPYAKRQWNEEDQKLLEAMIEPLALTLNTAERITRLNTEIAERQAETEKAQADLRVEQEAHSQTLDSLATARSESLRLSQELTDAQEAVADITGQLRTQPLPAPGPVEDTDGFSALRAQLQASQPAEEREQLEARALEAEQRAAELSAELERLRAEVTVEAESPRVEGELTAGAASPRPELEAELEQAQQRELMLNIEVEHLRAELAQLQTERQTLVPADDLARVAAELALAQAAQQNLIQPDEHARVRGELEQAQSQFTVTQQREQGFTVELERLRVELADAQQQIAEGQQRATELATALEQARAEHTRFNEEQKAVTFDTTRRWQAELEQTQSLLVESQSQEAALSAGLEHTRLELAHLQTEQQTLIQPDEHARVQAASQQRESELTAEIAQLQTERQTLIRPDEHARVQAASQQRESELTAELERLSVELAQLKAQPATAPVEPELVIKLRDELKSAQRQLTESRETELVLTAELERRQVEQEQAQRQFTESRERGQALATELEAAKKQLAARLQASPAPSPDIAAIRQQLAESREREIDLSAELDRLRAKIYHYGTGPLGVVAAASPPAAETFAQLQAELETARGQLAETQQREVSLKAELERAQAEAQTRAASPAPGRSAPAAEIITSLRSQLELARRQAEGRNQLLVELAELKEKTRLAAAAETRLHEEQEFRQAEADQLRKELDLTRAELKKLTEGGATPGSSPQVDMGAQTIATLREQLSKKERLLVKVQSTLVALQSQTQTAGAAPDEKERQLVEAQQQLAGQARQLTEATAALAARPDPAVLENLENQLSEMERRLLEAQATLPAEAVGGAANASYEVIASLTQDLRQPLSSIVGYSELLLGESVGILGALQKKFLERIKASSERMGALLDDLIRVTAIDAGPLKLVREKLDVLNVIEEAIFSCGSQFREKGLNLRLNFADDLPQVQADRDALRQIVTHLLNNAGSASAIDGEVQLSIKRESEQKPGGQTADYIFVSVRDSGGGIRPEDQPKVFSRIYRADAPLIAGLGDTGVGLSVAKALVEAHGGRIWLASEVGAGSTFSLLLPVEGAQNSGVAPLPPNGAKSNAN